MSKFKQALLGVGSFIAAGAASAQAASVDVSAATDAFTGAGTAIGLIGIGMVGAAAAGIVYRWVTAFLVK